MEKDYMEILLEEMRGKFDLVLEGHAALHAQIDEVRRESNEKHDLSAFKLQVVAERMAEMNGRIDKLETKVNGIAIDLTAHRADTEAHPRYLVRE